MKKVVVVTGAAGGIGSAIVERLLSSGTYAPLGIDIVQPSLWNNRIPFFSADAANKETIENLFSAFPEIWAVVNGAGLLGDDESHGGRSLESLLEMVTAHAGTALVTTEAAIPHMQNGGRVINISSIETIMPAAGTVLYSAAKGALEAMTRAYAVEYGTRYLFFNLILGNVNTPNNLQQYQSPEGRQVIEEFERRTPLRRSAYPVEVADMIEILLSERISFLTGCDIVMDGGYCRNLRNY